MSFKANRTRPLRYKRPALASMGYDSIVTELDEIYSACQDIQYYVDDDDGTLLNALDGDDEAEWEFKMAFSDLSAKAERLYEHVYEEVRYQGHDGFERVFNDCTVALIGDRYRIIGWDYEEEDYFPSHPTMRNWRSLRQENGSCGAPRRRSYLPWASAWVFWFHIWMCASSTII